MPNEINVSLIAKCLSKDRAAQKQLYILLLPYLEMIGKRYLRNESDLKDVLQETFILMFKNMAQFDIQKAGFKTWAAKITINNCLKYNSKNNRNKTVELIINLHEPMIRPSVIDTFANDELLAWLKKMPVQYFEVFNMYIIDGFSHDEIAEMFGIAASLSRKRLSRARQWLKKKVETEQQILSIFSSN